MAVKGINIPALHSKPDITKDVESLISVFNELPNFNNDLRSFCEYYGIYDIDERAFLSTSMSVIKTINHELSKKSES